LVDIKKIKPILKLLYDLEIIDNIILQNCVNNKIIDFNQKDMYDIVMKIRKG